MEDDIYNDCTEILRRKMGTLHSSESEEEEIYHFQVATVHEAESSALQADLKFKKIPSCTTTANATATTPSSGSTPLTTVLGPLICWNFKEASY